MSSPSVGVGDDTTCRASPTGDWNEGGHDVGVLDGAGDAMVSNELDDKDAPDALMGRGKRVEEA